MPASSWHWKVEPVFELENEKLALVWLVGFAGDDVIDTVGAVVSIVQVEVALPVLPTVSVAVTLKVCAPAASAVKLTGEEHTAAAPASSWHWKVEPVFELVNEKVAEVEFVGFAGCAVNVTVGAVVSTVQLELTGALVPAAFVACTWNVCVPCATPV